MILLSVDGRPDAQDLLVRKALSPLARVLSPLGRCQCCGLPWSVVASHVTDYTDDRGCFPLCELCWRMLPRADRLPFYRRLHDEWERSGDVEPELWSQIEAAVLEGR